MHELSLCQALMDEVARTASAHDAKRVSRVLLRLGPLSGAEAALLRNAFPIAAAGTPAEGAELVIEAQPIRVRCRVCGAESDAAVNRLVCGECGDWRTTLVSGDELLLASVELVKEEH